MSQEKLSVLSSNFYARCQKPKETEDQFADELQVQVRKVISVCPKWRSQVNEALKTQFAHWGCGTSILQPMAHNLLKVAPPDMTIATFQTECISIFGTRSRKVAAKTTVSTRMVKSQTSKADQPVKSANQLHRKEK